MRKHIKEDLELVRERILEMAKEAESNGNPLTWFEDLYSSSEGNEESEEGSTKGKSTRGKGDYPGAYGGSTSSEEGEAG